MWQLFGKMLRVPSAEEALPGRSEGIEAPVEHAVLGTSMTGPWEGSEEAVFGLGWFWGAERRFWTLEGVVSTAVGYLGGHTPNPTYQEVCSGRTGHNEVVRVIFDPNRVRYEDVLKRFWESHDPTQGHRQGNDVGTQYRSGIYTFGEEQQRTAEASKARYERELVEAGYGEITTEVVPAGPFYFAEEYHQQYLHKNPGGYCGLGGTGVSCPAPPTAKGAEEAGSG